MKHMTNLKLLTLVACEAVAHGASKWAVGPANTPPMGFNVS